MKVAILQWVQPHDRGMGTVERISTTGADCANFFKRQIQALGYKKFIASDNGQLGIEKPEFRDEYDWISSDLSELKFKIQEFLDHDSLGNIYLRAENISPDEEVEYKWWRIQFRNLH